MSSRPRSKKIYPFDSLAENCIELGFQRDLKYYIDLRQKYLALKLKLVRGRGYETHNSKEVKKEQNEETKVDEEVTVEEELEAPVPLVTLVNNILH